MDVADEGTTRPGRGLKRVRPLSACALQGMGSSGDLPSSHGVTLACEAQRDKNAAHPNGTAACAAQQGTGPKTPSRVAGGSEEAFLGRCDPAEDSTHAQSRPAEGAARPQAIATAADALLRMQAPCRHPRTAGAASEAQEASSTPQSSAAPVVQLPAVYRYRTVTFNFDDPHVPEGLQPAIQGDERLLKLCESGLPAWAIYAPQYGVWYRPWMRSVTYMLFVLVSAFSLVMGFYDLHKNVPFLDQFLRQVVNAYLPSRAVLQWLDEHVSLRLSILFAYLFGKSELALQLLRWLGSVGAVCRAALQPVAVVVGPPLTALWQVVQGSWEQLAAAGWAAWKLAGCATAAVFGPPLLALTDSLLYAYQVVKPFAQALGSLGASIVLGPLSAMKLFASSVAVSAQGALHTAGALGRIFRAAWEALKAGTSIAPAAGAAAREAGVQAKTWYLFFPMEALDVVRSSTVKVIRALQTLSRLCSQIAGDIARHRLTLRLRAGRAASRLHGRLAALVPAFVVAAWLWLAGSPAGARGDGALSAASDEAAAARDGGDASRAADAAEGSAVPKAHGSSIGLAANGSTFSPHATSVRQRH